MKTGNAQKIPFIRSINQFAENKWDSLIDLEGKAIPASVTAIVGNTGTIVTVKVEVTTNYTIPPVTIPVFGPQWMRMPLQVGDMGVVFPADTSIGNVSGLGPAKVDLSKPANLSALVFFPVGNTNFPARMNQNRFELYGPDGVILYAANKEFIIQVTGSEIDIKKADGSVSIKLDAAGVHGVGLLDWSGNLQLSGSILGAGGAAYAGNIHTTGSLTADSGVTSGSIGLTTHHHGGVTTGGGTTGAPTP